MQRRLLLRIGAALLAITVMRVLAGAAVIAVAQLGQSPVWAATLEALAIGSAAAFA